MPCDFRPALKASYSIISYHLIISYRTEPRPIPSFPPGPHHPARRPQPDAQPGLRPRRRASPPPQPSRRFPICPPPLRPSCSGPHSSAFRWVLFGLGPPSDSGAHLLRASPAAPERGSAAAQATGGWSTATWRSSGPARSSGPSRHARPPLRSYHCLPGAIPPPRPPDGRAAGV